ncbi:MAG: SBBP repeat-containing protein [Bacteroidetes bacterium]|nr:SBBP repeat-containing protein [Bacteroidota bacterium]
MKKIVLILLSLISFTLFAGNNKADKTKEAKVLEMIKNQPLEFIENKGQFTNTEGKPADNVFFKASYGNCDIYITDKGLSYVFVKIEEEKDENEELKDKESKFGKSNKEENEKATYYRMDMNLEGAHISKENITKDDESKQGHHNYFYAHCPEGIYNVKGYRKITIKNIYNGIDWVIYTNTGSKDHALKYDFIVHPQADYTDIKIKFTNADSLSLFNNESNLKIHTIAGTLEEGKLLSYQTKNNDEIQSKYIIGKDSVIRFEIAAYDTTKTLIIDPLVWATYYGDDQLDGFYSICVDSQDNIYISGYTFSSGFPTFHLAGAYWQQFNNGIVDVIILKFNNQGVRQWSTCYGGTNYELSNNIYLDSHENIYVSGYTSSINFPIQQLAGAYWQPNNAGFSDGFLIKFNNLGIRLWATYFGGSLDDNISSICIDSHDNIFIVGQTESNIYTQQLTGAYWQPNKAGNFDGFILKLNSSGVILWSTYYGGNGLDYPLFVCNDNDDNIYITGYTDSQDLPTKQSIGSYWQPNNAGDIDAFLIKFNNQGLRLWATYFGGVNDDKGSSICIDSHNNIFFTGFTNSTNFPLHQLAGTYWQSSIAGGYDIFIIKLDKPGKIIWSTFYGGSKDEYFNWNFASKLICIDKQDNIYISSSTYSIDFPTENLTGEFWQPTNAGFSDAFILKFSNQGVRIWATYYGTDKIDFCRGISIDNQNNVYFIGEFWDDGAFTVNQGNGSYYVNSSSGSEDSYIMKFSIPCNIQKTASLLSDINNICNNSKVNIKLIAYGGIGDTLKWFSNGCGQNYIGQNTPLIIPSPIKTITYYARWESNCGISKCDTITIFVNDCQFILELPNIITPNNDGINDMFIPLLKKNIEKMNTKIFNRWGNLLYETDNINIEWDGKYKGKLVSDGVYYWIIIYTDGNGTESMLKGSLTVLK